MRLRIPLDYAAPGLAGPAAQAERRVLAAFSDANQDVTLESSDGLVLQGSRTGDMVPLMQIAGGVAPDVLTVNFRRSATFIDMKLLYPLDKYIESLAGVRLQDSSSLSNADYFAVIRKSCTELNDRIPAPCQEVMRRVCPYGEACPYRLAAGSVPMAVHRHVWCFPAGAVVTGMTYDRGMLAAHAAEGVEQRTPKDWDELLRWAKTLTHPERDEFGLNMDIDTPSWRFLTLLYSAGGVVLAEDAVGQWRCVLDSDAAVDAAYFYARLRLEKIERDGRTYRGVVPPQDAARSNFQRYGLSFCYLDQQFMNSQSDRPVGFGPVPVGEHGIRASEFNSRMLGIFSGIANDPAHRTAAWRYIRFLDGDTARRLRTEEFVNAGLGKYVETSQLRRFNDGGRYDDLLAKPNWELDETFRVAFAGGVPEPYGPNCQYVYDQMNRPIGEMLQSRVVQNAIDTNDAAAAKAEIRRIFRQATDSINEKMLHRLPPAAERTRTWVAWTVIAVVAATFAAVFIRLIGSLRSIASANHATASTLNRRRQRWAWALMLPALGSIALWSYWPLIKGTLIAFQDYSVLGTSTWVGANNFSDTLFDPDFWYSMKLSVIYTLMFIVFGFWVPIGLALLLSEIPAGKTLFRTIYYLPAVLSGLVVILLWKSFYSPYGLVNAILNGGVSILNAITPLHLQPFQSNWLDNSTTALLCCLLPTIWAGMGPGCLIYLAALKTVPEEIYEAADIDGAGVRHKLFHIAIPSIKALVLINFVGAIIAAIRGASGFVLAMTGGGPYSQAGGATEVIGLKIFYTTFGALRFGPAAAMAWVLGAMLIGLTVVQLQRLSRMEFRTARKDS